MRRSTSKFCLQETATPPILTLGNSARLIMHGDDFYARMAKVYDGIFDQMPNDRHYQVLHIGYSKFFNADDDSTWCNGETFGKIGLGASRPKLTLELRRKLNDLTDELNSRLHVMALK